MTAVGEPLIRSAEACPTDALCERESATLRPTARCLDSGERGKRAVEQLAESAHAASRRAAVSGPSLRLSVLVPSTSPLDTTACEEERQSESAVLGHLLSRPSRDLSAGNSCFARGGGLDIGARLAR